MSAGALTGSHAEADLAAYAPHLLAGYRAALPEAAAVVGRRLRAALVREDIGDARDRHTRHGRRHAFNRVEFADPGAADPRELLPAGTPATFAAELDSAVINLAVALARQDTLPGGGGPADADLRAVRAERLAVTGHNLHPCGRTRLGWGVADVLAHDVEAGSTRLGFVGVRCGAHLGDDVGAQLAAYYPGVPTAPRGYRLQPVHVWQRDAVIAVRHRGLLRDGTLRLLDGDLPAVPTAALRTLLLPAGSDGHRRYVKVSLDILVTSTRRGISVASTRNGAAVSALVRRLLADDPDGHRLLLLAETGGAAVPAGGRDVSAILRAGLGAGLHPGEQVIPATALPARDPATGRTVLAGLVARYADRHARVADADAAAGFLDAYARLLLPALLRLTARGLGYEAHLQNCLPTFRAGVPHRLVLRDFAGLRLHLPRLGDMLAGPLWPGSVIGTGDLHVLRAKIGYTSLQAHLGELVIALGASHGLDEQRAWRTVRAVVDQAYEPLRRAAGTRRAADADHAWFTAPRMPHKALVRMRLAGAGDTYLDVENPLHAPA